MARKRMGFKPTLQDMRRASLAAQMAMAGPNTSEAGRKHLAEFAATVKPKRVSGPRVASLLPTEAEVQKAIITYLCANPKVCLVERHNSGAVTDGNYYVQFHHIWKHMGKRVRKADICGLLHDGRMFAIEVKRPPFTGPRNDREVEQSNYLELIRSCKGIGIFATSIDDVEAVL